MTQTATSQAVHKPLFCRGMMWMVAPILSLKSESSFGCDPQEENPEFFSSLLRVPRVVPFLDEVFLLLAEPLAEDTGEFVIVIEALHSLSLPHITQRRM